MTKYIVKPTSQFRKDYKLAIKRGKDIKLLEDIVTKLANGEPLDKKYNDHELVGNWRGHRECHIQPDWLLIYRIFDEVLVLSLSRTGSHNDLLGKLNTANICFVWWKCTVRVKPEGTANLGISMIPGFSFFPLISSQKSHDSIAKIVRLAYNINN